MKDYIYQRIDIDPTFVERVIKEWEEHHDAEYYDITTLRERLSPPLRHTRTYHLRNPDMRGVPITELQSTANVLTMKETPVYANFPAIKELIDHVGQVMLGGFTHIGRVFVTQLASSKAIGRHVDEGLYFDTLHRFHLVLKSKGSRFHWDDHDMVMNQGEVWMINNSIHHWVENLDSSPRTHLIFDGA